MNKKIIITACLFFFALLISNDQAFSQQDVSGKKSPEQLAAKISDRMKNNLSLSDVQYKQVYELFLTKIQNRQTNKEKLKGVSKEEREQIKKQNKEEFKKQLSGILSSEQMQKLEVMKSEHKQKHKKDKNKIRTDRQ